MRSIAELLEARLRDAAVGNAWAAMAVEHERARDWADTWAALSPGPAPSPGPALSPVPAREPLGRRSTTG